MSTVATTPTPEAKAVANGWVALLGFSFLAFLVGAAVQIGLMMLMDNLYGACVQSMGPCPPGSEYTPWQEVAVTIPTYLIWITPAIVAARKGQGSQREVCRRARPDGWWPGPDRAGDGCRVPDVVDPRDLTPVHSTRSDPPSIGMRLPEM